MKRILITESDIKNIVKNVINQIITEELHNVIHKVNGKWRIKGHHGYWNAVYDTKEDAEAGLKAYFSRKH